MVCLGLPKYAANMDCVATIGKFECVHLGHRELIGATVQAARKLRLPSVAFTFDPHPYRVLADPTYRPLLTLSEREYAFSGTGIDYLVTCPFDAAFAEQSPEAFCRMLFADMRCTRLVVGEQYRFGKNRSGNLGLLRSEAKRYGSSVAVVSDIRHPTDNAKISSSRIRRILSGVEENAVSAENPVKAAKLLGYPFFVMGTVRHGRAMGRDLGFPTLNIVPDVQKFLPADGVYVTRTRHTDIIYYSVTNVGKKPTVSQGGERSTVETHLLGFGGDLYGEQVIVEFLRYLRPERRYENTWQLREQVRADIAEAGSFFGEQF